MIDCEYTEKYNYKERNKLWSQNIGFHPPRNISREREELWDKRLLFKNKNNQVVNYKYFYIYNVNSIEILHKLNVIFLSDPEHLSFIKKIEFCDFLITYLSKSIQNIDMDILEKSFDFISLVLFKKCLREILVNNQNKIFKRSSYKFCTKTYQCEKYYKNNKSCLYDHIPTEKLRNDIVNIYNYLHEEDTDLKEINKSFNTILFVINSIYNENYMYLFMNI